MGLVEKKAGDNHLPHTPVPLDARTVNGPSQEPKASALKKKEKVRARARTPSERIVHQLCVCSSAGASCSMLSTAHHAQPVFSGTGKQGGSSGPHR
jgi:hypothetical protein